jgi:hypothetical protein
MIGSDAWDTGIPDLTFLAAIAIALAISPDTLFSRSNRSSTSESPLAIDPEDSTAITFPADSNVSRDRIADTKARRDLDRCDRDVGSRDTGSKPNVYAPL